MYSFYTVFFTLFNILTGEYNNMDSNLNDGFVSYKHAAFGFQRR